MKKSLTHNILYTASLLVAIGGALGSLYFTRNTGRYNKSVLLILVFVAWVLSPFAALAAAVIMSKHWPARTRIILYGLVLIVTLVSLIMYSGIIKPPGAKPAFVFIVVPLISWVLIAIVYRMLRRRNTV